jgi:hypothetical protein
MNYKKGDTVKVTDSLGKVIKGEFQGITYRKYPQHYAVKVKRVTKWGLQTKIWHLPEARFV